MTPEVKAALKVLDDEMKRLWGDRCSVFEVSCVSCGAWRTRDDLLGYLDIAGE